MKVKNIIICCVCLFLSNSPAFSYIGEKYDYFYQDTISKLFKISPDSWEIKIEKSTEPYGYKHSSIKGIFVSFQGKTKVKPIGTKRESDYESFYLVIMPPDYSIINYTSADINDHGPAMFPDSLLGEADGFKVFYRITGTVNGKIPTWLNWEKDIKDILKIK